jgi:hypothetical protein
LGSQEAKLGNQIFCFCAALSLFERKRAERIIAVCRGMELRAFKAEAAQTNPNIEVKALEPPPFASESEICCQQEFKLEAEG